MSVETQVTPETVEQVTARVVSEAQEMLKAGKTREEIRLHYGLTKAQCSRMFKHEDLKGKKVHTGKAKSGGRKKSDLNPFAIIAQKSATTETPVDVAHVAVVNEHKNPAKSAQPAAFTHGWEGTEEA